MSGALEITPLDAWIKAGMGMDAGKTLKASDLVAFQRHRLQRVIQWARQNSPFYRERLRGLPADFPKTREDLRLAPFTSKADLKERHLEMLCVSQSEISRVVTIPSPDSGAAPRRVYFTDDDLERTVDFFHHGMSGMVHSGSTVLICMPGQTPGGVGDLLRKALGRMGVAGVVHGLVNDPGDAVDAVLKAQAGCLVGIPVQMLSLARHPGSKAIPRGLIKSILLSADYVPDAIVAELEERFGATVFEHYGMTEMGLGGGVQCSAREGYHLRETDLLFEVVDPISGDPLDSGKTGEIVFTTLTRRGMPLIRYRTGDLARFLSGCCPCGTSLPRLGKIQERIAGRITKGFRGPHPKAPPTGKQQGPLNAS